MTKFNTWFAALAGYWRYACLIAVGRPGVVVVMGGLRLASLGGRGPFVEDRYYLMPSRTAVTLLCVYKSLI
jgi:hypothetical protein